MLNDGRLKMPITTLIPLTTLIFKAKPSPGTNFFELNSPRATRIYPNLSQLRAALYQSTAEILSYFHFFLSEKGWGGYAGSVKN